MRLIEVKQLDCDLTPVGGLALAGHYLEQLGLVFKRIDGALSVKTGVRTSDIVLL